jgi:two-component sensor histidine kinase
MSAVAPLKIRSRVDDRSAPDYARALLNILDDFAAEKIQSRDMQSAMLNILDDSSAEHEHFRDTQRAVLNILEDFGGERQRSEDTQKAVLNILADFTEEKTHLEEMKRAVLNILEDLAQEKEQLEHSRMEVLRSEQAVRLSLREKETLLKEVHHRVKNNLQVIASLLRLQSRYLQDDASRAMFQESQNRVHSISLVHEMLYQAPDLAQVEFANYLLTLTKNLSESWSASVGSVDIEVAAIGVLLAVDIAIPCGLIVNELVTNALKHAFPDGRPGSIRVSAAWQPDGLLQLAVQDNGIGLRENLDVRRAGSLGLELVATLTRQLRAKSVVKRDGGTTFEISFRVSGDSNR